MSPCVRGRGAARRAHHDRARHCAAIAKDGQFLCRNAQEASLPELNWDDLRVLLALDRGGSLLGAGRLLRVSHTTVARRLEALEQALQVRLFHRRGSALLPSEAALEVLAHARRVEEEVASLTRAAFGTEARLEGAVRLTAPLALITHFLLPRLEGFQQRYPGIRLELLGDLPLDAMLQGAADIGLRISKPVSDHLDIRRVSPCRFALYEAASAPPRPAVENPWVTLTEDQAALPEAQWLQALFPGTAPRLRLSTTLAMLAAAQAGCGMAALPCYLGDVAPGLRRVAGVPEGPRESLFLVTHREQRGLARVRALVDFLAEAIAAERGRF